MTRLRFLAVLIPTLALGLTACERVDAPTTASSPTPPHAMTMTTTSTTGPSGAAPSPEPSTPAATSLITISDFEFRTPATVAPGARVLVRNDDSEAHTVTSSAGGFDVKVDPGTTTMFTAPARPGSYAFACSFHAEMTGSLVVR